MIETYPRPDFRREGPWGLLDGEWEFARSDADTPPQQWPEMITVPYGWDTAASGVEAYWLQTAWYRRTWTPPKVPAGHQLVIHFGAVQHATDVFCNGMLAARHTGGQTPFEAEITAVSGGSVELCVRVSNPLDKGSIPHGKQRSIPLDPYDSCAFRPCSGIWQSVWWEIRPQHHVTAVALRPRPGCDGWDVSAEASGSGAADILYEVIDCGYHVMVGGEQTHLLVDEPHLWSPDDPHLYEIAVSLRVSDLIVDRVVVTTGLRTIRTDGGVIFLNGQRIFLRGVLDQGYWPGHGWTAPDLGALTADLDHARALGFNLVRKHLKLEDPRWLHHADRTGMLIWEEPASTSRYSPAAATAFAEQIAPMVSRDRNHPSIVIWGLYNEEWGLDWDVVADPDKQETLRNAYRTLKNCDASRPVVDCSGWSHVASDLADWHVYSERLEEWKSALVDLHNGAEPGFDVNLGTHVARKYLMADRGGAHDLPMINSEYGTGRTAVDRAWVTRWQTQELRRYDDNNGYVYTELYDVEHEFAGALTFDRSLKDNFGLVAADSHAPTVIIADIEPIEPGRDLVASDGRVELNLRVSHHGTAPLEASLFIGWSAIGEADCRRGPTIGAVVAEPYIVTEPLPVVVDMPIGAVAARLHLWLVDAGSLVCAHTVVDVTSGRI